MKVELIKDTQQVVIKIGIFNVIVSENDQGMIIDIWNEKENVLYHTNTYWNNDYYFKKGI